LIREYTDENGIHRAVPDMFNPDVFFKFESEELRAKCLDVDVANCGLTEEM
jgi:hypothetical protein